MGKAGDCFGWQCRWYSLPSVEDLGATRRKKIEEAIKKSEAATPGLTHWVLWTRFTLTKKDQLWFDSLSASSKFKLQQKTSDDLEPFLSGDATLLRNTYFGDLILTPERLQALHAASVATIKHRWIPEVHESTEVESRAHRTLGDPSSWKRLRLLAEKLASTHSSLLTDPPVTDANKARLLEIAEHAESSRQAIITALAALADGDVNTLDTVLSKRQPLNKRLLSTNLRKIRSGGKPIALVATNVVADIVESETWLVELSGVFRCRTLAVVADAGAGKTHMAVSITAPSKDGRPAGLLLFGQSLSANGNIDDLARQVVICGISVPGIESLIAALNSAGQRSRRRLPFVIDGLNEAEDPRRWKTQLAAVSEVLKRYPYVLLICTVRSNEFADEALPDDVERLITTGFELEAGSAARRYFEHFKIDARDVDVPEEMLRHPLMLRLFCEVANPKRQKVVGLEAVPGSMTEMFLKLIESTAGRIQELSSHSQRYFSQGILQAIDQLALLIWEKRSRSVDEAEFRKLIGDDSRPWDRSIVRAMEQEGLILRVAPANAARLWGDARSKLGRNSEPVDAEHTGRLNIAMVYDAMAGHVIADALVRDLGRERVKVWLASEDATEAFGGEYDKRHPLGSDVFQALVGVLPRRQPGSQLWALVDPRLKESAVLASIRLVADSLDEPTTAEVKKMILEKRRTEVVFVNLRAVRSAYAHYLNSQFLDEVLRGMTTGDRDLTWSEWIRRQATGLLADVRNLQRDWEANGIRRVTDHLRARWTMWLLTSNVRDLRDEATKALYWYGRNAAAELLTLTLESLSLSDPYVPERMLAALYGVAMAFHGDPTYKGFANIFLPDAARKVQAAMFAATAPHPTTHFLARDYARHIVELGVLHEPNCLDDAGVTSVRHPFPAMPRRKWESKVGDCEEGYRGPVHMDFGNYTIGRLVEGRGNYQYNNPEYQRVMSEILWRVDEIGYSESRFQEIDRAIGQDQFSRSGRQAGKVERYGKKYSWSAFFEMAGLRSDEGKLRNWYGQNCRISDCDIDPCFPRQSPTEPIVPSSIGAVSAPLGAWLTLESLPNNVNSLLQRKDVNGREGDWVLLGGYYHQRDADNGVGVFCHLMGILVEENDVSRVRKHLHDGREYDVSDLSPPHLNYLFAGEAGWADTHAAVGKAEWRFVVGGVIRQLPRLAFFEESSESDGEPEMTTWIENVNDTVDVVLPIVNNDWESYHTCTNAGGCPPLLGREVCDQLNIFINQETSEFRDSAGGLASAVVASPHGEQGASQEFLYLRRDLVDRLLSERKARLMWLVWGERELVSENLNLLSGLYEQHGTPRRFRSVLSYPERVSP